MTLFDACRIMAEWTVKLLIPVFEFQEGLFPPFSNPAGWVADWLATDGGLDTMAWFYAVNIALMIGMTNLILVIHLCLLYTSPSPRDKRQSRMPSSA